MLASEQAGYFTTAQAAEFATSPSLLSYYAASGTVPRVYPGAYRYRDFPYTPHEEIVAAWLAVGKETAVVSHESALDLWDLTDLIPDAIHLTVSRSRRNLPKLPGMQIHTTTRRLREEDVGRSRRSERPLHSGPSLMSRRLVNRPSTSSSVSARREPGAGLTGNGSEPKLSVVGVAS